VGWIIPANLVGRNDDRSETAELVEPGSQGEGAAIPMSVSTPLVRLIGDGPRKSTT
jgi:hypothetical protein